MKTLTLTTCLLALGLTACASGPATRSASTTAATSETPPDGPTYVESGNARFAAIRAAEDRLERDRLAILAMAGEYRVSFDFMETVELKAGYERQDDKESGGYETVIVVEDSPERIVLQHILVAPSGYVTKHWRQDWVFEAGERFEFVADQTWRSEPLSEEETAGAWTQCVFEVSDAPRYCGTGRWRHGYGVSTWTSDRSWRPLPRREYTKRDDYNALNVENRHTITPRGWTHEQDNTKVLRDGEETVETLVREFGFNDYRGIEGYDFSPAYAYWEKTSDYWALVREAWSERLDAGKTLTLDTTVDGMVIIAGTFTQAEASPETTEAEERQAIEDLLETWTSVRTDRVAATP
jgi:hypothetical protein